MKLENIQIVIGKDDEIGQLVTMCDLLIEDAEDTCSHPDNLIKSFVTNIEVLKIHSIELQAFNKVGIDLTKVYTKDRDLRARLEAAIIEEVEYSNFNELKSAS